MMLMRHQRAETPVKLNGVAAAREFFCGCFAEQGETRESLWVAHLDEQAQCLHLSRHVGDSCGVDFPLRDIVADAALHGSSSLLLAHNHPSGDPQPSPSDLRATQRLATAADAIDCKLLDHLVFAGEKCTSLRRLGYL
jgi:DNA repair protein RadC